MPFKQTLQNIYSLGINIISVLILDRERKLKAHFREFCLFQEGRKVKSKSQIIVAVPRQEKKQICIIIDFFQSRKNRIRYVQATYRD